MLRRTNKTPQTYNGTDLLRYVRKTRYNMGTVPGVPLYDKTCRLVIIFRGACNILSKHM